MGKIETLRFSQEFLAVAPVEPRQTNRAPAEQGAAHNPEVHFPQDGGGDWKIKRQVIIFCSAGKRHPGFDLVIVPLSNSGIEVFLVLLQIPSTQSVKMAKSSSSYCMKAGDES